jgi:hypothetical protein
MCAQGERLAAVSAVSKKMLLNKLVGSVNVKMSGM